MQAQNIIDNIEKGNTDFLNSKEILDKISLDQEVIQKILHYTLLSDKYLFITKTLWPFVQEDDLGLVKYDYYCYVLKQYDFSEKTARYICLKERDLKILNVGLLGKCGSIKAVDFLINAYGLGINSVIEGIATCCDEEQIPIMKYLLSRLNDLQKNSALNKFISAYLDNYPRDLNLVAFALRQKNDWNSEVLEHENIKKLMLFNNIDEKLTEQHNKVKKHKI